MKKNLKQIIISIIFMACIFNAMGESNNKREINQETRKTTPHNEGKESGETLAAKIEEDYSSVVLQVFEFLKSTNSALKKIDDRLEKLEIGLESNSQQIQTWKEDVDASLLEQDIAINEKMSKLNRTLNSRLEKLDVNNLLLELKEALIAGGKFEMELNSQQIKTLKLEIEDSQNKREIRVNETIVILNRKFSGRLDKVNKSLVSLQDDLTETNEKLEVGFKNQSLQIKSIATRVDELKKETQIQTLNELNRTMIIRSAKVDKSLRDLQVKIGANAGKFEVHLKNNSQQMTTFERKVQALKNEREIKVNQTFFNLNKTLEIRLEKLDFSQLLRHLEERIDAMNGKFVDDSEPIEDVATEIEDFNSKGEIAINWKISLLNKKLDSYGKNATALQRNFNSYLNDFSNLVTYVKATHNISDVQSFDNFLSRLPQPTKGTSFQNSTFESIVDALQSNGSLAVQIKNYMDNNLNGYQVHLYRGSENSKSPSTVSVKTREISTFTSGISSGTPEGTLLYRIGGTNLSLHIYFDCDPTFREFSAAFLPNSYPVETIRSNKCFNYNHPGATESYQCSFDAREKVPFDFSKSLLVQEGSVFAKITFKPKLSRSTLNIEVFNITF